MSAFYNMQGALITWNCVLSSFVSLGKDKLPAVSFGNRVVQQRGPDYERKQIWIYFLGKFILSMEPRLLSTPCFLPSVSAVTWILKAHGDDKCIWHHCA